MLCPQLPATHSASKSGCSFFIFSANPEGRFSAQGPWFTFLKGTVIPSGGFSSMFSTPQKKIENWKISWILMKFPFYIHTSSIVHPISMFDTSQLGTNALQETINEAKSMENQRGTWKSTGVSHRTERSNATFLGLVFSPICFKLGHSPKPSSM